MKEQSPEFSLKPHQSFYGEYPLLNGIVESLVINVCTPDRSADIKEMYVQNSNNEKFMQFPINGKIVTLGATSGFEFFPYGSFYLTGSPSSQARYAARLSEPESKILVLVQVLYPNQMTSHHRHYPFTTEKFSENLLKEDYYAYLNGEVVKVGQGLESKDGQRHCLFTLDNYSVSVVELHGLPDHEYFEQPSHDSLRQSALKVK